VTGNTVPSDEISRDHILQRVRNERERFLSIQAGIRQDRAGWPPVVALVLALLINTWAFLSLTTSYMLFWISASLYFYIFYPLLPLFLFPFRYFFRPDQKPMEGTEKPSALSWARRAHIFRNKRVGFRLFWRFFIASLLPLTTGMICIYLLSLVYSAFLCRSGVLPGETYGFITVQCIGIILFYIEIFFFRERILHFTRYVFRQGRERRKKVILLALLGLMFLFVATAAVILLLLAILLPGFTLLKFINVSEFLTIRTNLWIPVILVTQVVIVQFLQYVLSRKVAGDLCNDLMEKLDRAVTLLDTAAGKACPGGDTTQDYPGTEHDCISDAVALVRETELYAINRRQMFKLFPTYSIGINVQNLLSLKQLDDLEGVFPK
jgi:hypothetical protein